MSRLPDRIASLLRSHVGRDNLISAIEIAARLRLHSDGSRIVREMISEEDWEAREMPVVAIPGAGYFIASDIDEFHAYDSLLAKLEAAAIEKRKKFRRLAKALGIKLGNISRP